VLEPALRIGQRAKSQLAPRRSHSAALEMSANAGRARALDPWFKGIHGSPPGAHVVLKRNNSRSLSNSNTSCAVRDIARPASLLAQMTRHIAR